jgi:hypothetical protein
VRLPIFKFISLRFWAFNFLMMAAAAALAAQPTVALCYGDSPPWDELRAFDVVVVEPGMCLIQGASDDGRPRSRRGSGRLPERAYLKDMPEA